MFDIGWSEMLVVGVVALIVVGPKDLPKMFHTLGEITGKARGMAREFQRAMNVAAKEAGVDGIAKDIRKVTDVTSGKGLKKKVTDAVGFDEIEEEFKSIGGDRTDVRKSPKAQAMPGKSAAPTPTAIEGDDFDDESDADEAAAADHDADLARRNAEFSAVEAERLKRAEQAADARQHAARLRTQREADADIDAQERQATASVRRETSPEQAAPVPAADPQSRDDQS